MNHVTLKEVAKAAGVSLSSASYALRGSNEVSANTRAKVRKVAKKIGYNRHPMVAALMSQVRGKKIKSFQGTLAYIYSSTFSWSIEKDPYFAGAVYRGAHMQAKSMGFKMEVFRIGPDHKNVSDLKSVFYNKGIDGILIGPLQDKNTLFNLDLSQFSAVAIGFSLINPNLHRVAPDTFSGMLRVMDELKLLGYARPGFVLHQRNIPEQVLTNFLAAFQFRLGTNFKPESNSILQMKSGEWKYLHEWYDHYKPDVVISFVDETLKNLRAQRKKNSRHCGFVLIDNTDNRQKLSHLDQCATHIGQAAVDELMNLLYANKKGIPEIAHTRLIPPKWVKGKTLKNIQKNAGPIRSATSGMDPATV